MEKGGEEKRGTTDRRKDEKMKSEERNVELRRGEDG